jgi:sarcosine oxidase subunit beta
VDRRAIVGGGGHGLATAFYLAENHGIRNVAVVEKGYIGGGNVGRLEALPPKARRGDNANAFKGGFALWHDPTLKV